MPGPKPPIMIVFLLPLVRDEFIFSSIHFAPSILLDGFCHLGQNIKLWTTLSIIVKRCNARRWQRQTLMRVLTRAKKQREIRSDADLDSMADFFESTLAGIRMAAKAGKSRRALRNIAAFASRAYMASDRRIAPE